MARLHWHGAAVRAKVAEAAKLGTDKTMAECVSHAKDNHPSYPPASLPDTRFANRTAFLVNSIQILDGASSEGEHISGQWGSDANYSLYLEIGTSIAGPSAEARAIEGMGDMDLIPPPVGPLMAPRPYLRPATDAEYPLLAPRIGAAFRGEQLP
jgi:hypothetical protein